MPFPRLLFVLYMVTSMIGGAPFFTVPPMSQAPVAMAQTKPWLEGCKEEGARTLPHVALQLDASPTFDLAQGEGSNVLAFTIVPERGAKPSAKDRAQFKTLNETLRVTRIGGQLVLEYPNEKTRWLANWEEGISRIKARVPPFVSWQVLADKSRWESNSFMVLLERDRSPSPRSYKSIPQRVSYDDPLLSGEVNGLKDTLHTLTTLKTTALQLISEEERIWARRMGMEGRVDYVPMWVEFRKDDQPAGCLWFH